MTMEINVAGSSVAVTKMDLRVSPSKEPAKNAELERHSLVPAVDEAGTNEKTAIEEEPEKLEQVAKELSDMMSIMRKGLSFKVDDKSGQHVVSVMDIDSGDIIRQIPSEEALKLAEKLSEVAGFLMKTEA